MRINKGTNAPLRPTTLPAQTKNEEINKQQLQHQQQQQKTDRRSYPYLKFSFQTESPQFY